MNSEIALEQAKRSFAIQDIFVCESNIWSSKKLALGLEIANPVVQYKLSESNECSVTRIDDANGQTIFAVHFFVGTLVRILAGGMPNKEPGEDQLVATIDATFLARYMSDANPTPEMLQAFNDHAVHHVWPYWREYIESTTTRLRVPLVVIALRHSKANQMPPVMASPVKVRTLSRPTRQVAPRRRKKTKH
jgi:hypothetical protein